MTVRGLCQVRIAHHDDLDRVLALHAGGGPAPVATLRHGATWQRTMVTHDLAVYVAEVSHVVVGTATSMMMPNITYQCAPTAFVEAVVVDPDPRRNGVATALVQRVLDDARAAGCNKVQLLSHKRHATDGAHRLDTGLGFDAEAEGFRLYLQDVPAAVLAARPAATPAGARPGGAAGPT